MSPTSPHRPRVARETRLLLAIALLSSAALWMLARVQPASVTATAATVPLLSPFALEGSYARLADDVARVQSRLEGSLVVVDAMAPAASADPSSRSRSAGLRLSDDRILTVRPAGHLDLDEDVVVIGHDPASGLTLASTTPASPAGSPVPWLGESPRTPRYLVATDVSGPGVTLRPLFVGGFDEDLGALGPGLLRPRARIDIAPGTFLFTLDGELAGVVVDDGGSLVVLSGQAVLDSASRLEARGLGAAGDLGVRVQPLTPALASATGSSYGVVVTRVDAGSQASQALTAGDVIATWDGQQLLTARDWEVRVSRVRAGDPVRLGVRSRGESRETSLVAAARTAAVSTSRPAAGAPAALGLTMRRVADTGTAVTGVTPGSAADRAGLARGDMLTRVGNVTAPTPQQLTRAFSEARAGEQVLVAVTRADGHFVTTLGK